MPRTSPPLPDPSPSYSSIFQPATPSSEPRSPPKRTSDPRRVNLESTTPATLPHELERRLRLFRNSGAGNCSRLHLSGYGLPIDLAWWRALFSPRGGAGRRRRLASGKPRLTSLGEKDTSSF